MSCNVVRIAEHIAFGETSPSFPVAAPTGRCSWPSKRHHELEACASNPGPKMRAATQMSGRPEHTYSCNSACGGDTEFIKGGDISSG